MLFSLVKKSPLALSHWKHWKCCHWLPQTQEQVFLFKQLICDRTQGKECLSVKYSSIKNNLYCCKIFLQIKLDASKEETDHPGVRDTSITPCFTSKNLQTQKYRPNTFLCVKPLGVTWCWNWKSPADSGIPLEMIYAWPHELSSNLSLPSPVHRTVV